jgi:hypothetical protein
MIMDVSLGFMQVLTGCVHLQPSREAYQQDGRTSFRTIVVLDDIQIQYLSECNWKLYHLKLNLKLEKLNVNVYIKLDRWGEK